MPVIRKWLGLGLGLGLNNRLSGLEERAPGGVTDGLAFWYRADNITSVDDEDAVGQWIDKTEDGVNHAIQSTAGFKPQLAIDVINGRRAVRFDGADDYLSVTTPPDLSAGITLLAVYHVWTRTDIAGVVSLGNDDAVNDDVVTYFALRLATAASGNIQVFRDATDDLDMTHPEPETVAQALVTVVDNVAAPGDGEYRDQVNADITDTFTDPAPAFGTPDNIILGARQLAGPSVGSHLEVDLYEVAAWVPALSPGDLDDIEIYVEGRYQLSTVTVHARPLASDGGAMLNSTGGFMILG